MTSNDRSQPSGFLVAATTVDITPSRAIDMGSGTSADSVEASPVPGESLEANFVLLQDENNLDDRCLLVSLDLLYPGAEIRAAIENAATDLPADRIFLAASHTHRAPMTCVSSPTLGMTDSAYLDELNIRLAAAVQELMAAPRAAATLWLGEDTANHSINRRLFKRFFLAKRPRINFLANAPNPNGPTDEVITAAELREASGKVVAMIWNYACHPVSHPETNRYSSHFPGVIRTTLRANAGQAPVLFFQGFSGNTRPRGSARVRSPKEIVRRLFSGPLFDTMTWPAYTTWSNSLAKIVRNAFTTASESKGSQIVSKRVELAGTAVATTGRTLVFHSIQLGPDFQLVGVSGEPVAEYASVARAATPLKKMMCVGCIDEPAGYIPTDQKIEEGGYECDRSRRHFEVGEYLPGYQQAVERALYNALGTSRS